LNLLAISEASSEHCRGEKGNLTPVGKIIVFLNDTHTYEGKSWETFPLSLNRQSQWQMGLPM